MAGRPDHFPVIVIGAGSGGLGAAYAAACTGARVLLIEREALPGGTFVHARVNCWEPAIGGTGLPERIFLHLRTWPDTWALYPDAPTRTPAAAQPDGASDAADVYALTLRGHVAGAPQRCMDPTLRDMDPPVRFTRGRYGLLIEPLAYARAVGEVLAATDGIEWLPNATFTDVKIERGRLCAVHVDTADGARAFTADCFIDGTAEAIVCRRAGCVQFTGVDPRSRFDEPDAPEEAVPDQLNGATLMFRISRDRERWADLPDPDALPARLGDWTPARTHIWRRRFPNGDWTMNMLPTFIGSEFSALDGAAAHEKGLRRVLLAWRALRDDDPFFRDFDICEIAPHIGVREGPRTQCAYMLRQRDVVGPHGDSAHEDAAALADHALDVHGPSRTKVRILEAPYGIPLRCAVPRGVDNLFVVSRGAGFSHIASSSCRLSRTLMQLGQSAGAAAALAVRAGKSVPDVPWNEIRDAVGRIGAVLDPDAVVSRHAAALASIPALPDYPQESE